MRRYFLESCTSRRAKTREREPFENAPGAASSVIGFRQARGARRAARKGGLGHQEPDRGLHVRRAPARGQTSTRVEAAPVGALIGALGTSAIVQRRSTSTEFETFGDLDKNSPVVTSMTYILNRTSALAIWSWYWRLT